MGELVWELLHGCSVTTVGEEVRLESIWLSVSGYFNYV